MDLLMTPEEKRIAIGEECGFTRMAASGLMWNEKENRAVILPGSEVEKARHRMKLPCRPGKETLPDYLHDRNDMHSAILVLRERGLLQDYWRNLWRITNPLVQARQHWDYADLDLIGLATTAQQADAFLVTVGRLEL